MRNEKAGKNGYELHLNISRHTLKMLKSVLAVIYLNIEQLATSYLF